MQSNQPELFLNHQFLLKIIYYFLIICTLFAFLKRKLSLKPDFSTIDTDGDGVISFEEFSAKKPPHGDAQTIFDSIDADGNGEISEQELSEHKPPRRER